MLLGLQQIPHIHSFDEMLQILFVRFVHIYQIAFLKLSSFLRL